MLMPAVVLDTAMTAAQVLARLARYGFWVDPQQPQAQAWIAECAQRMRLSFDAAAQRLMRSGWRTGAALRRQWGAQILWYARPLEEVMHRCADAPPDMPLLAVLDLHEHQGEPPVQIGPDGSAPGARGVVFDGATPVFVSVPMAMAAPPRANGGDGGDGGATPSGSAPPAPAAQPTAVGSPRGPSRGSAPAPAPAPPPIQAWPRIDAPEYVPARQPFTVVVGLASAQQRGVSGGQVTLPVPAAATTLDVGIELIADGLDAPSGWSRTLTLDVANPTAATVSFDLVGREPPGPEPVHLTTLEVRYVLDGSVRGTASRALVIGPTDITTAPAPASYGTPWQAQPATATAVDLRPDPLPADLTIEIAKPNGNPGNGQFVCRLFAPQPLTGGNGPFAIDLGQDAKTFAKSIVEQIRNLAADPLVENLLDGLGRLVADQLPSPVVAALREVAARTAPRVPCVLLVSADPYVPWEIALLDPPLDATRPPFLGAQVALGRWLRDARAADTTTAPTAVPPRPAAQPPATIAVKHMAVMAGMYQATSGLRRLPEAEAEAQSLAQTYDAIALAATTQDVKRLLDAQLTHKFQAVGGVEAVHFAGHGDFDPNVSDPAVLMLSEGKPLPSILFRSARYGGPKQPLFFLNACMIGIGGELLGDMGGFPGNCLKGGFGALLGALWEVDDAVAHRIALEFWQRALPTDSRPAQPVGEVLRDLRAQYHRDTTQPPIATYLAYVYYGHPRLTLQRAA